MRTQPETSLQAWAQKEPTIKTDHAAIFAAMKFIKAGTYEAIAGVLEVRDLSTVTRRLKEMEGRGMIRRTDRRGTTTRGRKAIIWEVNEAF